MNASDRDALKGMILEAWIEDLRHDNPPRVLAELKQLSEEEISEVMGLARWSRASLYQPDIAQSAADARSFTTRLRGAIRSEAAHEDQRAAELIGDTPGFGALLSNARHSRNIDIRDLERALALPQGALTGLESGSISPHRVPQEKMLHLLRGLRVASKSVIELVRSASLRWVAAAYGQPETQLGRLDGQLSREDRRELLEITTPGEDVDQLVKEVELIETYCQALSARLA